VAERRGRQVAVRRREGRGRQGVRLHRQLPPPPVRRLRLRRPEDAAGGGGPRLTPACGPDEHTTCECMGGEASIRDAWRTSCWFWSVGSVIFFEFIN
jgi:hypothetical protein